MNLNDYMKDLEKKHGKSWHGLSKAELSFLERIQLNKKAKKRVSSILEKPLPGMLSVQVQALNFMKRIGWYNKQEYSVKLKNLIGDLFKENLDNEQKDAFCSLQVQIDLSLEDLPKEKWNKYTIPAIGCSKTSNIQVHLALFEVLKDPDKDVRNRAAWALGEIKPTDPQIHLALAEALKDPDKGVRSGAALALGEIKPTDPQIHLALAEALKDPDKGVRSGAALALGEIKPTDPQIHLALAEALKDPDKYVRRSASWALKDIKPTDPQIHLALAEALKDPDADVRMRAARALGAIKPTNLHVLNLIKEVLEWAFPKK